MERDSADILGGRLNIAQQHDIVNNTIIKSWTTRILTPPSTGQLVILLLLGILLFVVAQWISSTAWWKQYKERRFRLKQRRRHGIPDTDTRPFSIAYTAALRRRQEEETARTGKRPRAGLQPLGQQEPASPSAQSIRRRLNNRVSDIALLPASPSYPSLIRVQYANAQDLRQIYGESDHGSPTPELENHSEHDENQDQVDRSSSDEPIVDGRPDGVEQAAYSDMDVDDEVLPPPRGAKRAASSDDDEDIEDSGRRGKRARRISAAEAYSTDESMEQDDIPELPPFPRGRKRDRVEAGSTIGDDSGIEDEGDERPRRHRRRRIASVKRGYAGTRGQKRTRDDDSGDEAADASSRRATRQRREHQPSEESSLSLGDGMISQRPLTKGRRIGEVWQSGGITYKVGPNGQRLRQALVKRTRSRFPMPVDSEHPDREVNIDFYIETWLTEREYAEAKRRGELPWGGTPRETAEPETPRKVLPLGKSLPWKENKKEGEEKEKEEKEKAEEKEPEKEKEKEKEKVPEAEMEVETEQKETETEQTTEGASPTAIAANLRDNPGTSSQPTARRVSILPNSPPTPTTPESQPASRKRTWSKWERQDLEAAAMERVRRKALGESVSQPTPPSIMVTPALSEKPAEAKTGFSFPSKPSDTAASSPFNVPPALSNTEKKGDKEGEKKDDKDGEKETAPATSIFAFGAKSSDTAATPPTSSGFFGPKPSTTSAASATSSSGSTIPNFFGAKGTGSAPPSVPSGGFNIFGAASKTDSSSTTASTSQPEKSTTPVFGAPSSQDKTATASSQPESNKTALGFPGSAKQSEAPKLSFNFGSASSTSGEQPKASEQPSGSGSSGPSLLSRLGGFVTDSQTAGSAPATSNTQATSSAFNAPSVTTTTTKSTDTSSSTEKPQLKFNFFNPPKSTAPSSSATPAPSSSDAPKSTASIFGGATTDHSQKTNIFGGPSTSTGSSNAEKKDQNKTATPTLKFNFTAPSGSPSFPKTTPTSGGSVSGTDSGSGEKKKEGKKKAYSPPKFGFSGLSSSSTGTGESVFGGSGLPGSAGGSVFGSSSFPTTNVFGGGSNFGTGNSSGNASGSAFGQTSALGTKSTFGQTSTLGTKSAFGNTSNTSSSNIFGSNASTKDTKSAFSAFANPTSTSSSNDNTNKSAFSAFATPSTPAKADGEKPSSAFGNFSNTSSSNTSSSNTTSAFGAPQSTSAFGAPQGFGAFSANNDTNRPKTSIFGLPNTSNAFGSSSTNKESSSQN